jgi:hypothetical protein
MAEMTDSQLEKALEEALSAEEAIEGEEEPLDDAVRSGPESETEERGHPPADEFEDPEEIAAPGGEAEQDDGLGGQAMRSVSTLLGVQLWYERGPGAPGPRSFPVASDFVPLLERTVRAVTKRAPRDFGELERIVSAGIFVNKPGAHGLGHACDWDRLVFENVEIAPKEKAHLSSARPVRQRYWAFAAICRSVMAPTLHGESDAGPHDDHVHQADNMAFAFSAGSPSTVSLCQAVLNEIFGHTPRLAVDGDLGPKTQGAIDAALQRLRLGGTLQDEEVWQRFLRRSGRLGFVLSVRQ